MCYLQVLGALTEYFRIRNDFRLHQPSKCQLPFDQHRCLRLCSANVSVCALQGFQSTGLRANAANVCVSSCRRSSSDLRCLSSVDLLWLQKPADVLMPSGYNEPCECNHVMDHCSRNLPPYGNRIDGKTPVAPRTKYLQISQETFDGSPHEAPAMTASERSAAPATHRRAALAFSPGTSPKLQIVIRRRGRGGGRGYLESSSESTRACRGHTHLG